MPEVQPPSQEPQLSDTARTALEELATGVLGEEKSDRRSEVRKAWQQRSFRNGIQHIWYDKGSYSYMLPEASGKKLPRYMDDYNIYTPHWRSFVSLLGSPSLGVNFIPKNLQRSVDVTAAAYSEKMRHYVDHLVNMSDRQAEAASYFCTDGRTMTWTRIDNDKLRCTVHGVLESKVPIFQRRMENWGYAALSEEGDKYEAKDQHPDFAEEMDSGNSSSADSTYERTARLGILSNRKGGSSESLKNLITRHVVWIRPSRFRKVNEQDRPELKAMFPNGVRVTLMGTTCVEAIPEAMEDALRVEWPSPGQGQSRPSMLHDLVPIQESYNDYKNNLRESADYINPATWVDGAAVDSEALPEQRSEPGAIHVIDPPGQKTIDQCVFQETSNGMSPDLIAACEQLKQDAEFVVGDLPSLYGGDTEGQDTVGVNKLLNVQAKGQLSSAWSGLQWLFAGTYEIAVKLAAQLTGENGSLAVSGPSGQESFNPSAILDGEFGCYPDADASFPETMADKRASLQAVLSQLGQAGPDGLAIVMQPDNLKLVKQSSGLSDLVIPGAEARDKQLREIEQLLQEPPIPDETQMQQYAQTVQQALAQGQQPPPPPMTSSIPVDTDWDYHQPEYDKVKEWLSSDARFEEERKGNTQGIQNVKLHGKAHQQALAAQAPKPQVKPPNVTLTAAITDPNAISQLLGEAGAQTTPQDVASSQVPEQQKVAAETSNIAAGAQHKAVLAAKEAVTPIQRPLSPEQQLEAKKSKEKPNGK